MLCYQVDASCVVSRGMSMSQCVIACCSADGSCSSGCMFISPPAAASCERESNIFRAHQNARLIGTRLRIVAKQAMQHCLSSRRLSLYLDTN